jgi:transposase-like protein
MSCVTLSVWPVSGPRRRHIGGLNHPGFVEALIPRKGGVMLAPQKYPPEVRDRAIRLVDDLLSDDQLQLSVTGACRRVAEQLGINRDTLRGWVKQAQIDAGARPGVSSDDRRRWWSWSGRTAISLDGAKLSRGVLKARVGPR